MWNCVWNCLRAIPWWVWLVLTAIGAVIGLVSAIVTALSGGTALALTPILMSVASGILSAYASTIINCVKQCKN